MNRIKQTGFHTGDNAPQRDASVCDASLRDAPIRISSSRCSIDRWSLIGLVLLLAPLLTMAHELLGHALTCVAVGHTPTALGAYYIECPTAVGWRGRVVSMAGTGVDVIFAALAWLAWRRARRPLPRLVWWIVFIVKGMVSAGYWMYSGVTNLGDWGPDAGGGIGPLPWPWAWRAALFAIGLIAYISVVRLAIRMLRNMLGGGEAARRTQWQVAMTVYLVGGATALLVSLFNPMGIVITLASAVAASFGGTAGLFSVAYARHGELPRRDFRIDRNFGLLAAGVAMTVAFADVLGPTIFVR